MDSWKPSPKIRVLLADHHPLIREGLKSLFAKETGLEVVGEASDGIEALRLIDETNPDVLISEVTMPRLSGVEITRKIAAAHKRVRILILTAHTEQVYMEKMLSCGATGYLLKNSNPTQVLSAIGAIASGTRYVDPAFSGVVTKSLSMRSLPTSGKTKLSEREQQVLHFIALGHTNREIAGVMDLSVKTVENYKTRAVKKLGFTSRAEIVRYVADCGTAI